jgi:hypothetical protein
LFSTRVWTRREIAESFRLRDGDSPLEAVYTAIERRKKVRFSMTSELRYRLLDGAATGQGMTIDLGSGGVAFMADNPLPLATFIELSVSWPVLLADSSPMRLNVVGRVLRSSGWLAVCTVDKYEFRIQAPGFQQSAEMRRDANLRRWADRIERLGARAAVAATA